MEKLNEDTKVELLTDHYQKTYELTYSLWTQRNRTFLLLLAVIAVGTLLTYRVPGANSLFVACIASVLDISEATHIRDLQASFPFALLQSILLIIVFYLIVTLYHRSLYVLRNYAYMGALEKEIRELLTMKASEVAFTRESDFYWRDRSLLLGWVKWVYIVLLGSLLFAFLFGRLLGDLKAGDSFLAIVDGIVAVPTAVFFLGYATSSVRMDSEQAIVPAITEGNGDGDAT